MLTSPEERGRAPFSLDACAFLLHRDLEIPMPRERRENDFPTQPRETQPPVVPFRVNLQGEPLVRGTGVIPSLIREGQGGLLPMILGPTEDYTLIRREEKGLVVARFIERGWRVA